MKIKNRHKKYLWAATTICSKFTFFSITARRGSNKDSNVFSTTRARLDFFPTHTFTLLQLLIPEIKAQPISFSALVHFLKVINVPTGTASFGLYQCDHKVPKIRCFYHTF